MMAREEATAVCQMDLEMKKAGKEGGKEGGEEDSGRKQRARKKRKEETGRRRTGMSHPLLSQRPVSWKEGPVSPDGEQAGWGRSQEQHFKASWKGFNVVCGINLSRALSGAAGPRSWRQASMPCGRKSCAAPVCALFTHLLTWHARCWFAAGYQGSCYTGRREGGRKEINSTACGMVAHAWRRVSQTRHLRHSDAEQRKPETGRQAGAAVCALRERMGGNRDASSSHHSSEGISHSHHEYSSAHFLRFNVSLINLSVLHGLSLIILSLLCRKHLPAEDVVCRTIYGLPL